MITTPKEKLAAIIRCGFFPILVEDKLDALLLAELCLEEGIPAVEYSLRRRGIRETLPEMRGHFPNLVVLAASTVDEAGAVAFLNRQRDFPSLGELHEMGVDGAVSMLPFRQETYQAYRDWLFVPGVETAGEGLQQLSWGAHLLKFFNTEVFGGPLRIKALRGPTHGIFPITVTGGMRTEKVLPYIDAGALVIAGGFDIILGERYKEMQEKPDRAFIRSRLRDYLTAIGQARQQVGQAHWAGLSDADALLEATGRYFPF